MTEQHLTFTVGGEPGRLDKFLVAQLPGYSRARLQALIKTGEVTVAGQPARKTGQIVEPGTPITVHIPPTRPTGLIPEAIPLDIIFENTGLIVVNKPAGMVAHPGAGHAAGTLVHAALAHAPEMEGIGGELRPGIVHRLDKDTSGLILLAKNDRTLQALQDQFRGRQVKKVYLALVNGAPPTPTGRIEAVIGRDPGHRQRMAVVPAHKGREAVTEYFTLEPFEGYTLLEAHPLTGRTHQIRVHMGYLGCPIVGDRVYGPRKAGLPLKRHFLHAARLTLTLPGETTPRTFEAPLPAELAGLLETLRAKGISP